MVNLQALIDDAKCCETVRAMRWPDGVRCTECNSAEVTKDGRDDTQPERQRYRCHGCGKRFDDLIGTVFAGHHQPLRVWVLWLYFMGLNLTNEQIAQELGIAPDDAQVMGSQLREGVVLRKPEVTLSGEVECDEAYVVAGHKGHPEAVKKKGRAGRRRRLKGGRGRGTLAKENPPIFGMIQRTGEVMIRMLANVKQATIGPLIKETIAPGSVVYTDEDDIYARLPEWGYTHRTVCHAAGEFARDEEGAGCCEVHVTRVEGFWSRLRSCPRPHRGISQGRLPLYLGFFEFVHNVRRRGRALLGSLIELLVAPRSPG